MKYGHDKLPTGPISLEELEKYFDIPWDRLYIRLPELFGKPLKIKIVEGDERNKGNIIWVNFKRVSRGFLTKECNSHEATQGLSWTTTKFVFLPKYSIKGLYER